METEKQEIEIDVPKGWKAVGFRRVKSGEYYVRFSPLTPIKWTDTPVSCGHYIVVEKVPVFRGVTLEDFARVLAGQVVRIRFSDPGITPVMGSLNGLYIGNLGQIVYQSSTGTSWAKAEIEVTDETTN